MFPDVKQDGEKKSLLVLPDEQKSFPNKYLSVILIQGLNGVQFASWVSV